ncbi:TPA: hypothetical protein ACN32D_004636 [Vibrio parahaemolyticus]|uniref:hypothetical protein n=1 Tax=Vibrio parahaemolyticus TaxID=670 RepID=UPI0004711F0F|nr:hypothetical protein [Vibrio parahaemolyticus]EGQ7915000.1 hypothetical protein [Vibrio parahaemolyticus]EHB9912081.1 hypothetical protein [Vibrio parahaemolyticus]EKD4094162.1 hypothetical protein [Vibrio parahaemolyticus]EKO1852831.1 hypothetical protein [Vibrio parahaemolyticus]ELA7186460.1 hypothetical protein [Vibrio parahaemolyticus]
MSIDHLDHRAQPRVNREWYERTKTVTEENGTCASEAMRKGAELLAASLDCGVVPECQIDIDVEGKIVLTPVQLKESD